MRTLRGAAAIVGIGETALGIVEGRSAMDLNAEAAMAAIAESGLEPHEIDGLLVFGSRADDHSRYQAMVAEHLGLTTKRFTDVTKTGGASSAGAVRTAAAMIATGQCENVLIVFGDNIASGVDHERMLSIFIEHHHPEFEIPYGPLVISLYAIVGRRFMHEFGWTSEQLAAVAVSAREYARLNPAAQFRTPLTVEDVLKSRMVTSPLHLFDCAPISDGAAALVVTKVEDAERGSHPPVYVRGAASRFSNYYIHNLPDYTDYLLDMTRHCSDEAFAMAGMTRPDVDVVLVGDPTTVNVPVNLAGTGFVSPAKAGEFVVRNLTGPGSALPVNTHGGNLSCAHPGTPGQMLHVLEAVRQLRGDCGDRQVPGARNSFIHGQAGVFTSHCSLLLSRDR